MNPGGDSWLAIVNPAAGGKRGSGGWSAIERALRTASIHFDCVRTSYARQGQEIARAAIAAGRRRLLVAGGDGSVHDVVNGVMDAGLRDTTEVTLAVAPLGTGNDWARSLGISRDASAISGCLSAGRCLLHDVGLIEFPGSTPRSHRWFVNVAGSGFDARVVEALPALVRSRLAYLRGALHGLAAYRSPEFQIDADGERIEGRLVVAFVANARYCGHRMHIAPGASLDDGLFDLVLIDELGFGSVLLKLPKLYRGTILADPVVRHRRAARVRITTAPATPVQADGQLVGRTPAVFTLRPRALRVIVA